TVPSAGATEEGLARMMVGREVLLRVDKPPATPGEPLLEVENLHVLGELGLGAVNGVSFDVRRGEIVGLAGVDGNGQSELVEALSGLRKVEAGAVRLAGRDVTGASAHDVLHRGLGHIPEDRQRRGLVLNFSLAENLALHDYDAEPNARFGWLFPRRLVQRARGILRQFDVRGGGPQTLASALSGGNQQKVVVGREISRDPHVLLAAQPTRGLDVGAIEFVHRRLVEARSGGAAVLLVSLELDEILSLSDRILVIYEGRIAGEYPPHVSEEELGLAMTGGLVILATTGKNPLSTYHAIFDGTGLNWFFDVGSHSIGLPFSETKVWFPWDTGSLAALNLQQTLIIVTPLILTGIAVAFAFRCGLFNIGGSGQYTVGALVGVQFGVWFAGMPKPLHVLLVMAVATIAGAVWAGIAGILKATVGAHEVITTIMLNWIALWIGSYLVGFNGPMQDPRAISAP